MTHPKSLELKLKEIISEYFKNFELRFNDYCAQDFMDFILNVDGQSKMSQLDKSLVSDAR